MNGNFGVVRAIFFGCSVAGLWGCAPIRPVAFEPFADGNFSVTMSPMSYSVGSTGKTILVPAGFVTDFASTPRAMWSFLPPFGTYQKAAVMHDYLYWTQGCTRKQADDILWEAMVESEVQPNRPTDHLRRRACGRPVSVGSKLPRQASRAYEIRASRQCRQNSTRCQ